MMTALRARLGTGGSAFLVSAARESATAALAATLVARTVNAAARPAAQLMAGPLGWDAARIDEEVDHYLRRVEAERQSQRELTDREADEKRVQVRDIVS